MTHVLRSAIKALTGLILVAALGLAAMRLESELLAGIMFLVTRGVLCLAFIALFCRGQAERAWWLGFNVFGWAYDRLAFWEWDEVRSWLPTARLLELLGTRLPGRGDLWLPFFVTGQCLFTLLVAVAGGIVAVAVFRDSLGNSTDTPVRSHTDPVALRSWWAGPAIAYVVVLALVTTLAVFCSATAPRVWAGATYLLTWGLSGLAGVGAVVSRGRRREVCVGASLMGVGFMLLVVSGSQKYQEWPGFPTVQFLNALRPYMPPAVSGGPADSYDIAIKNAHIRKAIEQTVPMRFSNMKLIDLRPADPYLIAGPSIMALIAIGVGGVLAPIVSDLRRRDAT